MKQLIEARIDELAEDMDFNRPLTCLEFMRQIVVETTIVLDTDFAPDEHFVFIRLPIVGQYE